MLHSTNTTSAGSGALTPEHDDPDGPKNRRRESRGRDTTLGAILRWCGQLQLLVGLVAGLFGGTWSSYHQFAAIRRLVEPMAKKSCADWPVEQQRQYGLPCRALYEEQGVALAPTSSSEYSGLVLTGVVVMP